MILFVVTVHSEHNLPKFGTRNNIYAIEVLTGEVINKGIHPAYNTHATYRRRIT